MTDKGSIYCSNAPSSIAPTWSNGGGLRAGAYSEVKAGEYTGTAGGTYYWYKVNTSKMDGTVVQMMLGQGSTPSSNMGQHVSSGFACYLTDKGSIYCSNDPTSIAPTWTTGGGLKGGAYSEVKAGEYTGTAGGTYYWYKVNTSKLTIGTR